MAYMGIDPTSVRYIEAEHAFRGLGVSKRAMVALIKAGVFNPGALAMAPWTDSEAGAKFSSLRWRLSVDPDCTPRDIAQLERLRADLRQRASAA